MTQSTNTGERTAAQQIPDALRSFGELVHAVGPDGWSRDTPCLGWTVRDLVNHLTSEHLWAPPLLSGATIEDVGTQFDGDVLGGHPGQAWDDAAQGSGKAWSSVDPGATVHLSWGPVPVAEYAEQMLLDLVVHGWDLARAIGRDDRPDADRARQALRYVEGHREELTTTELFGTPLAEQPGDDDGDRLLRLLGRDPAWHSHLS
jgi:uncharacterized protein (TIGR03086 family)